MVIENRTGAGGNIGADMVAKAAPDGYTIGIGSLGTHAVNVHLFSKMPFDPVRDFAPVVFLLEAEGLLVLHPSVPAQNVPELIALARAKPGARSRPEKEFPGIGDQRGLALQHEHELVLLGVVVPEACRCAWLQPGPVDAEGPESK